jgi:HEPN domain-containing protein
MAGQHDLATDLVRLAAEDHAAAKTLLDADSPPSIVGFHCQQAVEKALKAVLADQGLEFPYTHNLGLLMQLCEDGGAALPIALADVDRLTPFAVQMRYGGVQSPDLDLDTALGWADQTIGWSRTQLDSSPDSE